VLQPRVAASGRDGQRRLSPSASNSSSKKRFRPNENRPAGLNAMARLLALLVLLLSGCAVARPGFNTTSTTSSVQDYGSPVVLFQSLSPNPSPPPGQIPPPLSRPAVFPTIPGIVVSATDAQVPPMNVSSRRMLSQEDGALSTIGRSLLVLQGYVCEQQRICRSCNTWPCGGCSNSNNAASSCCSGTCCFGGSGCCGGDGTAYAIASKSSMWNSGDVYSYCDAGYYLKTSDCYGGSSNHGPWPPPCYGCPVGQYSTGGTGGSFVDGCLSCNNVLAGS